MHSVHTPGWIKNIFQSKGSYRKNVYLELVFVLIRLEANNIVQQPRVSLKIHTTHVSAGPKEIGIALARIDCVRQLTVRKNCEEIRALCKHTMR